MMRAWRATACRRAAHGGVRASRQAPAHLVEGPARATADQRNADQLTIVSADARAATADGPLTPNDAELADMHGNVRAVGPPVSRAESAI
jgi:hypothetical protein